MAYSNEEYFDIIMAFVESYEQHYQAERRYAELQYIDKDIRLLPSYFK